MSYTPRAPEKAWPMPEASELATNRRVSTAAGPICSHRSSVIDGKLRELGYLRECVMDGRRVVSVVTIPLRAPTEKAA